MCYKSEKGQVTIFLSIIMIIVLVLSGVLVDGARLAAGEAQVQRAVSASIKSALAEYDTGLKDDYGIFSMSRNDENDLEKIIYDYICKNLMIRNNVDTDEDVPRGIDIYGFRIEDISVTPIFNLTENTIVKNQILEYMKYRAPKQMAENILDRLLVAKDASKMSEAYKKKTKIDRLAGKIAIFQQELKKLVSGQIGDGKDIKIFVNGFNQNGVWKSLAGKYGVLVDQYRSLLREKKNLENKLAGLAVQPDGGDGGNYALELERQIMDVSSKISSVLGDMQNTMYELREKQTIAYIKPNKSSIECIKEIFKLSSEIKTVIADLREYLLGAFGTDDNVIAGGFREVVEGDIREIEDALLSGKETQALMDNLSKNCSVLEDAVSKLNQVDSDARSSNGVLDGGSIIKMLESAISGYGEVSYDYKTVGKSKGGNDPRDQSEKAAKDALKKQDGSDKRIESFHELPSHKKVESKDFSQDNPNTPAQGISDNPADSDAGAAGYEGDLENLGDEVDFNNEDEGFSDKAFGFIGSLGDVLGKGLPELRDNLYINEYIMGIFKNAVPVLKNGSTDEKDLNFHGQEKSARKTFFDYETEYILNGKQSQNSNLSITKNKILLVRFALDTLHVYMDPEKKLLATQIAAATSGWWTAGLGIPIVSNLIMCGWGMGEALIDLDHIMKGEPVPFYKLKGDWELDIGMGKNSGPKTDRRLMFSYYDYLRLFLLFRSTNDKLNRIEDLIELNRRDSDKGFKMSGHNTMLRVEATISMKYLFLSRLFAPERSKTLDGRHKFKIVLYDGY